MLRKQTPEGTVGTVIPDHSELRLGTLKGALKLARVSEDEFSRFL